MFTVTLDNLRPHTSAVNQCAWNKLLCTHDALLLIESAIEDVMYMAAAPCSVTLTSQPEAGLLQVEYQWVGDVQEGSDMSEFLRLALIDCLLEDAGVAAV